MVQLYLMYSLLVSKFVTILNDSASCGLWLMTLCVFSCLSAGYKQKLVAFMTSVQVRQEDKSLA